MLTLIPVIKGRNMRSPVQTPYAAVRASSLRSEPCLAPQYNMMVLRLEEASNGPGFLGTAEVRKGQIRPQKRPSRECQRLLADQHVLVLVIVVDFSEAC